MSSANDSRRGQEEGMIKDDDLSPGLGVGEVDALLRGREDRAKDRLGFSKESMRVFRCC